MAGSKKFWLGMALGALAGGAISLFDKPTRQSVQADVQKVSGGICYIAKNPNEFVGEVKDTVNRVRTTVAQVTEDVSFIAERVEEMKAVPPQVADIVQDTKDTFGNIMKMEEEEEQL